MRKMKRRHRGEMHNLGVLCRLRCRAVLGGRKRDIAHDFAWDRGGSPDRRHGERSISMPPTEHDYGKR
jgi:hypothetical protein